LTKRREISTARLEIYSLAIENNCQKSICQITKRGKATVSEHISELLRLGAIIEVSGDDKVKFYAKGPKASTLDATIKGHSSVISRGGRQPPHDKLRTIANSELSLTPNYAMLSVAASCQVHSHGVRAKVEKVGDMQWLKEPEGKLNSNVQQMFGKINLKDGRSFSVKFMESPKAEESWLYVWVEAELSLEEMQGDTDAALMGYAQDAFNHISKHYGWKFGLLESHKGSKTHFVPNSELIDAVAPYMPENENIEVGTIHTDRSPPREDGMPTIETKDKATAIRLLTNIDDLLKKFDRIEVALIISEKNQEVMSHAIDTLANNQAAIIKMLGNQGIAAPEQPTRHEPGTGGGETQ
jgi:hypothetical protein